MKITRSLRIVLMLLAAWAGTYGHAYAGKARTVVLVADARSNLAELSQRDLRKLYLGFAYADAEGDLIAVRNESDDLLYQVFLQKVLYMSARTYERQLATRSMHAGMKQPDQIFDHNGVASYLQRSSNVVTFMWADDALLLPQLKVVQTLWQGYVD